MHRRPVVSAFVLAAALALVGAAAVGVSRHAAVAQDATPTAAAGPSLAGAWQWGSLPARGEQAPPEPPTFAIFHADGTYTEVLPNGSVLFGVWQPTGERTATLTLYENSLMDDRLVQAEGRFTVEVDEGGNTITEEGTFVGLFEDGSVAMAFESPATGTRMAVLPVEPLGTPVFPADPAAAGTPTP